MEKKLEELKVVLDRLVLPSLPDGTKLIASRELVFNKSSVFLEIKSVKPGRLHGVYHSVLAEITIGKEDWFFGCNRYELPTVIAATELVDIAVEKVLGMSCGYEMRK